MEQPPQGSDRLKEVALLLKQADKLVKEGDLAPALELIVKARAFDSRHLYALAYEERIRTLLNNKQHEQAKREAQTVSDQIPIDNETAKVTPTLHHLSNLAIIEAQHSATMAAQQEKAVEIQIKEDEEKQKHDELRRNAIEQKIIAFLNRATSYFNKKEFNRALDEIARAYLLDPINDKIHALEDKIRKTQEDSRVEEEEELQRKYAEEKLRREQLLKTKTVQLQKEREEKLKHEEGERKRAQEQKVQHYLQRVNALFVNNKLDEALSELAFVIVIDPLNEEVLKLEQKIIETQERRQQEQLELYQKQLEERQRKRQAIFATIQKHIENAETLAKQHKFTEALRTITRATVLDPVNEDLQDCERRILAAQEEFLFQEEEKRVQIQDQIRKQQEEELLRVERANRQRVIIDEQHELEIKTRADKEKISKYLERSQNFLNQQHFEVALGEVALAFIINPFDEDVKKMEQQIIAAREEYNKKKLAEQENSIASEENEKNNIHLRIAAHMQEAEQYRISREYSKAFNEVAKAFIIDPINEAIQYYENTLQEEFDVFLADQHLKREQEERDRQIRIHIERAHELLERELFEESLTEIASGLNIDKSHEELISLRDSTQAAYRKWQVKQLEEARNIELQKHFLRAKELFSIEKFNEALDEVQKAITLDPYRSECLALKNEIEATQSKTQARSVEPHRDQLAIHISNAERYINANTFGRAIIEIVYGLVIDPANRALLQLEKKVVILRSGTTSKSDVAQMMDHITTPEERKRLVAMHLHVANELRASKEFSKALDELTQAYIIDPVNEEIARIEIAVRTEQHHYDQKLNQHLKLIYPIEKAG
jgi:tetratricopeptide (TPR) repeat protein